MKRLLFIAHRVPYPPDKGERVRAFHEIDALSRHFRIVLAALAHDADDLRQAGELQRWCERVIVVPAGGKAGLLRGALNLLGGKSVTEGYFHSARLRRGVAQLGRERPTDLAMGYSSGTLGLLLAAPARRRAMDLVDADSAKWSDYADNARPPRRWLYRREAGAVAALERRAVDRCDAVFIVSAAEAEQLGDASGKVTVVANGVDIDYFRPRPDEGSRRAALVFTGTMDYRPNVQGVCWFVRRVWPALKRAVPDLTFTIVGRNPVAAVRRLGAADGITVTGSVPDVRPHLRAAAVAVCPLLIARGIQNKVLEAMASGLPVVASGPALEGLEVRVGVEVLCADTPAQWRESILSLLSDAARARALASAARRRVETSYTWSARMAPLVEVCRRLAEMPAPEVPAAGGGGRR